MNRAASIALSPFSLLYSAAMKARTSLYRSGVFRIHKVSVPVISVGNISTGGTGKTPLVQWIANAVAERGRSVCVVTRGYGRANVHQRVVVSEGTNILARVNDAGDEALMLAESLIGKAAVVCDRDRVAAAKWAIENLKSEVLILDDGFQHLRLARDLDIVVIDATRPFDNGWVLPSGMLREPISGLNRADCVVIARAETNDVAELQEELSKQTGAPAFIARTIARGAHLVNSKPVVDLNALSSIPFTAFCGLGNPDAFFQQLHSDGLNIVHTIIFPDHHWYSQNDIDRLGKEAAARNAQALITTAKDDIKLRELNVQLPCYVLEIETEIQSEARLLDLIAQSITKNPSQVSRFGTG